MPLDDDYLAALEVLATALADYRQITGSDAVLVGGAATAILTAGMFPSGDFDLVAGQDEILDAALLKHGFVREDRMGKLRIGYYHPGHPRYGLQQVSGALFDGLASRDRLLHLAVGASGVITLPAVEDMIADRLAQHAIAPPTDDSRLRQAVMLARLFQTLDKEYLLRRIKEEGGDASLLGLDGGE